MFGRLTFWLKFERSNGLLPSITEYYYFSGFTLHFIEVTFCPKWSFSAFVLARVRSKEVPKSCFKLYVIDCHYLRDSHPTTPTTSYAWGESWDIINKPFIIKNELKWPNLRVEIFFGHIRPKDLKRRVWNIMQSTEKLTLE